MKKDDGYRVDPTEKPIAPKHSGQGGSNVVREAMKGLEGRTFHPGGGCSDEPQRHQGTTHEPSYPGTAGTKVSHDDGRFRTDPMTVEGSSAIPKRR